MQFDPPKYQDRVCCGSDGGARDDGSNPLDHEGGVTVPVNSRQQCCYAKDFIPLENICNVTVVTDLSGVGKAQETEVKQIIFRCVRHCPSHCPSGRADTSRDSSGSCLSRWRKQVRSPAVRF